MYLYQIQLVMTDYRQVDINSKTPLSDDELEAMAIIEARREFGDSDDIEVEQVETISQPKRPGA